jgi:patatin-like phospholipase/acyl hydrolase
MNRSATTKIKIIVDGDIVATLPAEVAQKLEVNNLHQQQYYYYSDKHQSYHPFQYFDKEKTEAQHNATAENNKLKMVSQTHLPARHGQKLIPDKTDPIIRYTKGLLVCELSRINITDDAFTYLFKKINQYRKPLRTKTECENEITAELNNQIKFRSENGTTLMALKMLLTIMGSQSVIMLKMNLGMNNKIMFLSGH